VIKNIVKIFAIFFLVIVQLTLVPYFAIGNVWPNLVFILVLVLVIFDHDYDAYLTASFGGLMLDLASPMFFGFFTLILMGFALMTKFLVNKFLTGTSPLVMSVIIFICIVIYDSIFVIISHEFNLIGFIFNILFSIAWAQFFLYILNLRSKRFNISTVRLDLR